MLALSQSVDCRLHTSRGFGLSFSGTHKVTHQISTLLYHAVHSKDLINPLIEVMLLDTRKNTMN